jgi:hypothetical protein
MNKRWTFRLRITALALVLGAVAYDAKFAGIPFQDATREQQIAYVRHSKIAAGLMRAGLGLAIASLILPPIARAAKRKRG